MYPDIKKTFSVKKNAVILAIESSCDETAAAVIKNGREILSSKIMSSATEHVRFGGVVPEIASRAHTSAVSLVVKEAVDAAGITLKDLDAVAVTYGAGLLGALLVGVSYAKSLAYALDIPLVAQVFVELSNLVQLITDGLHERVDDRLALELLHKIIPELLDVINHP